MQIKLKNSVVQDSAPSTSDLPEVGELAVNGNINSIGGFMRASDNSIVKIFGPGSVTTPTATTTVSGIAELATSAETTTGSATNRVVTPAGLNAVTVAERSTSNTNYVAKAGSTLTGVLTMPNGSNSAPAINFGDSDSGIFGGTNTVSLAAGGTTRLTADTGVSVVGTLAVTGAITSTSDLTIADKIIHAGDTNTAVRFPAADTVSVETSGSERLRADSLGHFIVGSSTARTNFFNSSSNHSPRLQVEAANTNNGRAAIGLIHGASSTLGPYLALGKHRGSVGGNTIVQSADEIGKITFQGNDGTQFVESASIVGFVDGTPGADDMPGRLVFSTTADGAASPTTRLTIDSAGTSTFTGHITTTGNITGANVNVSSAYPSLTLEDTNHNSDYRITNNDGQLIVFDITSGATRVAVNADGHIDIAGNVDFGAGIDVTGNITATGDAAINGGDLTVTGGEGVSAVLKLVADQGDDNGDGWRLISNQDDNDLTFSNNVSGSYVDKLTLKNDGDLFTTGDVYLKNDSKKLKFGVSEDLQIYHDGTHSYIENTTGDLRIIDTTGMLLRSNSLGLRNGAGDENYIGCAANGAVELYYDNSKKFETTSTGVTVTGDLTFADSTSYDINLRGGKIYGDDGALPAFTIQNTSGNSNHAKIIIGANNSDNGGIEFYGAGSSSSDLKMTIRGNTDTVEIPDNHKFVCGNGSDLQIYHDGTNSNLKNTTGTLYVAGDVVTLTNSAISELYFKGTANGAVELYYDNSKKFNTESTGAQIFGNLRLDDNDKFQCGNAQDLQIYHDGTDSFVKNGTGVLRILGDSVQIRNNANNETGLAFAANGALELFFDNSKKFETTSSGATVTGSLGIGVSSPAVLTHIYDSTNTSSVTEQLRISGGDRSGDNFETGIRFFTQSPSSNGNRHYRITSNGNTGLSIQGYETSTGNAATDRDIFLCPDGGDVGIGQSSVGAKLHVSNSANQLNVIVSTTDTFTGNASLFSFRAVSSEGGFISLTNNGTTTAYGTSSDYRLKENATTISDGITRLKTLKPYRFNFKAVPDTTVDGFFAHELTAVPEAVVGEKDAMQEIKYTKEDELPEGKNVGDFKEYSTTEIKPQGVDYSKITPLLTAALQEAITKIETLETKVAALEAA